LGSQNLIMLNDLKLIPKILLKPGEFFDKTGEQSIGELYKFWVPLSLLSLISGIIFGIITLPLRFSFVNFLLKNLGLAESMIPINLGTIGTSTIGVILNSLLRFIISITFGFLSLMLGSSFLHFLLHIFGCRGYKKTLTAITIASTPTMVLGSIPIVGLFAGLYSLIIEVVGLSKLHKISNLKTLAIVLIPIILLLIIIGLMLFATAYIYMSGAVGVRTSKAISILDASCSNDLITLVVSNDGTVGIDGVPVTGDIHIYVNNVENTTFPTMGTIEPHKTDSTNVAGDPGPNTILVVSPSNSVRQVVYC